MFQRLVAQLMMPRHTPKQIQDTISVLQSRSDQRFSEEDARQALDNILGFLQILRQWDQADPSCLEKSNPNNSSFSRREGK
ncbi:MAG: hypothetical protein VW829_06650 [Deltaproteobacteria bacterium]